MVDVALVEDVLELYSWFLASFIVLVVGLIALFYQRKFNIKTYYFLYAVPLVLLLIAALSMLFGDGVYIEIMEAGGALLSLILTWRLYSMMMGVSR